MSDEWHVDVLGEVRTHGRLAAAVTVGVLAVVAAVAVPYFMFFQPVRSVASMEFTPMFAGASEGRYPNRLPFGPSDVVDETILSIVFDNNNLKDYCPREVFDRAFFVDQQSDELAFLEAEFNSRLSDLRLTAVDRERIQSEYQARRSSLPRNFQLTFVKPQACSSMPTILVSKVLTDVLATWAKESEVKRGVLRQDIEVLSPSVFDLQDYKGAGAFIRAGVIRNALQRVAENLTTVRTIQGASLVHLEPEGTTFLELHGRLTDLMVFRLTPAIVAAARNSGREAQARDWITEAIANAERNALSAEGRVDALRDAMREFAGTGPEGANRGAAAPRRADGAGGDRVAAQVDANFVDLLLTLSKDRSTYAQKLTDDMVVQSKLAVQAHENAATYKRLLPMLDAGVGRMSPAEVEAELADIVRQGKALTLKFNDLYTEFSRVSLRSATAMYRAEKPMSNSIYRPMTSRQLMVLLLGTLFGTLLLSFGFLVVRGRMAVARRA